MRERAGQLGLICSDPLILPSLVVLHLVAVRVVDGGKLLRDHLAVRSRPPVDLIGADMQLPSRTRPRNPAVRSRVLEWEAGFRHVVGVANVEYCLAVGLGLGIRFVHDGENRWPFRRRPAAEDPWPLERIASERSEADHGPTCAFI